MYLARDGAVAWVALEKDVHSDAKSAVERRAEEQSYLASAAAGTHGIARALAALDPVARKTRVLRAERPFTVVTEAGFARVDRLLERILADLRVPGYASLTRAAGSATLFIHADVAAATADESDRDTLVAGLAEDLAQYRIVLTEGRFTGAQGFTLSDDGVTATPTEMSQNDVNDRGGIIELSLTWENR